MAVKTKSLSFRVPKELRKAIRWCADREEKSQADYMMDSTLALIETTFTGGKIEEILLPEGYEIPTDDSKMFAIRVTPEFVERIRPVAPRFYHSVTRLLLWASGVRAAQIAKEYAAWKAERKKKKEAARKTAKA